ncbi:MAG: hypothetical protein FJZ96_00570 [Chloroflexi bacterium]|nr:hypothetical protein [Chloroflexota bacterium]
MKRDFNTWMLFLIFGMPVLFLAFIAGLYFIPCGLNNDCSQATLPGVIHTPVPTIIPATMVAPEPGEAAVGSGCSVSARTLLQAWASSGSPDVGPFEFIDASGTVCTATYADVSRLFSEANLWYPGALACITCHHSNLSAASAQLDLSAYAGMAAGSRRATAGALGNDILGAGEWDSSILNRQLFVLKVMPFGRPPGLVSEEGPTILAGKPK